MGKWVSKQSLETCETSPERTLYSATNSNSRFGGVLTQGRLTSAPCQSVSRLHMLVTSNVVTEQLADIGKGLYEN